MKKKSISTNSFLKWTVMLVLAFILSLPLSSQLTQASMNTYRVKVDSGYLALRSSKAYNSRNEIGQLSSGYTVEVSDYSDSTYWYVYVPALNKYGYVNMNYLVAAPTQDPEPDTNVWTVKVDSGYLALRNDKNYNTRNEIGKLYTGDTVTVSDYSDNTYWYVYSFKLKKYGYVNKDYLYGGQLPVTTNLYTVAVDSGYLALRNDKAYNPANEIGQLYKGDTVEVTDYSDSNYWYVYAPRLNMHGYVNKDYLIADTNTYNVKVSSGYLALRSSKAYDSRNEIGQLYTGDTVTVSDYSDSTYWYVYAPSLKKYGYVNKDYLITASSVPVYPTYTVKVKTGYLALRSAMAYDPRNEIGQLYNGDTVQVHDSTGKNYWYVYAPALDKYGYVNKKYLY